MSFLTQTPVDTSTIFSNALQSVQTSSNSMISAALPVALGIAGVVLAIGIGWKVFKKFAK